MMKTLGIIGLGNMGGVIARGLALAGMFHMFGYDPDEDTRNRQSDIMHILPTGRDVARQSDMLLLAVKPQIMRSVLTDLEPAIRPETCIISIAAGITLEKLVEWAGQRASVVRVMPNTPAMIGRGVYALCLDHALLTNETKASVMSMFAAIGKAHALLERLFDAYTGLIGSGPAYIFAFMEALIDAGVTLGLARPQATEMVQALLSGTVAMAGEAGTHPALLREMVTSPGGTTIAGLNALDKHRFRFAVNQAVAASARRSKELGG